MNLRTQDICAEPTILCRLNPKDSLHIMIFAQRKFYFKNRRVSDPQGSYGFSSPGSGSSSSEIDKNKQTNLAHSFPKMFKCLHVPRYGSELKPVLTQKILIPIPNFLKMGLK